MYGLWPSGQYRYSQLNSRPLESKTKRGSERCESIGGRTTQRRPGPGCVMRLLFLFLFCIFFALPSRSHRLLLPLILLTEFLEQASVIKAKRK